jgi:hypothetical protein
MSARGKAKKLVATLLIARGAQGGCSSGPRDHGVIVFFVCLCVGTKLEVEVFGVVMPATIPRGLIVLETPSSGGKVISQNMLAQIISMTMRDGIVLKGKVLNMERARSFTILMCRSISSTCSLF